MVTLDNDLASLEAESRHRGGTKDVDDSVPSLGGEHLNNDGDFNFTRLKYIPHEYFPIMRKGIVRLHDILEVKDGVTTGKMSFVRDGFPFEHAAVNEHVFIVRVSPEIIHPTFAFYFLFSNRGQVEIRKDFRDATIGGISHQFLKKVNIPLPFLSEQRRIVEILDQADALRKKRAEAEAKAARILPVLFYKMFGDPATNPKGWPKKKLGDLIKVKSGNFLPAKDMDPSGKFPVYGGNGINGFHSEFMFEEPVIVLGRVGVYCGEVKWRQLRLHISYEYAFIAILCYRNSSGHI